MQGNKKIKRTLPDITQENLDQGEQLDLRRLDTSFHLDFAEKQARSLRNMKLDPDVRIKKSDFFEEE